MSESAVAERVSTARPHVEIQEDVVKIVSIENVNSRKSMKSVKSEASGFSVRSVRSSRSNRSSVHITIAGSVTLAPDTIPIRARGRSRELPVYTKSDSSVYPSYTNLILPYRVVCRQRYQNDINKHHDQFIKEIRLHERLQPYALGGVRLRREFCDPILVKVGYRDIIALTIEEERRLEYLLKTDPKEL